MKPSEALNSNRAAIRHVVESHRACNARGIGSVLRGQDTDGSDLDILIDPTPETTLLDIGAIRHELGKLLGVPVDVLTRTCWKGREGMGTFWAHSSTPM
ncbi:nucleotidyltransferase family protein [Ectothiorhodospira lacustris]|uniref:nucleotidyltransferase family protein n=1 Tax=Ectothiorhodospira lacustris TaxID=2899127 RepID=UPI001EE817CC|nr:nucleotidyltransferase domain-containing protein [Ectothiorhodospira lacustris]MCG5501593.1 nucleotidyltransferase domain-containing protein [Ectothiorhodospira lacustris]